VEEDVSGGQELAAGRRETGNPALGLEDSDIRSCSELCACVCWNGVLERKRESEGTWARKCCVY